MRKVTFGFLLLCLVSLDRCSDIPRKFLGSYSGKSPNTTLRVGNEQAKVEETLIRVLLSEEKISLIIGATKFDASYELKALTKSNLSIEAAFEEPLGSCTFSLPKKGKKMIWQRSSLNEDIIFVKD